MTTNKASDNGATKPGDNFEGKEIEFPVTFHLKAVMTGLDVDDKNKQKIEAVIASNKVDYKYLDKKASSKGSYESFSYQVTLKSKEQMTKLYDDLKKIEELKFAL